MEKKKDLISWCHLRVVKISTIKSEVVDIVYTSAIFSCVGDHMKLYLRICASNWIVLCVSFSRGTVKRRPAQS